MIIYDSCRNEVSSLIQCVAPSSVLSVYYDKICLKFASHHFLLYAVYICQKSLNFIYAFKCYQEIAINVSWPHFSWPTLYEQFTMWTVNGWFWEKHIDTLSCSNMLPSMHSLCLWKSVLGAKTSNSGTWKSDRNSTDVKLLALRWNLIQKKTQRTKYKMTKIYSIYNKLI